MDRWLLRKPPRKFLEIPLLPVWATNSSLVSGIGSPTGLEVHFAVSILSVSGKLYADLTVTLNSSRKNVTRKHSWKPAVKLKKQIKKN